jgi:cytochrome P450
MTGVTGKAANVRPEPLRASVLAASLTEAQAAQETRDALEAQGTRQAQDAQGTPDGPPDAGPADDRPEVPPPADETALAVRLISPEGRRDPYPLYAAAHAIGPVLTLGGGWFAVVGYAEADQVLRGTAFGVPGAYDRRLREQSQRDHEREAAPEQDQGQDQERDPERHAAVDLLGLSILESDPPEHTRMRALVGSVFTPRRIAALRPMVTEAVDALLDGLAESGRDGREVDFMAEFAYQLPVTVICGMLGVPRSDRHRFRTLAARLTSALELVPEPADEAAAELAGYFTDLIAERRARPDGERPGDLVGALIAARDAQDGRLSEAELLANLALLLIAGFETTTDLLGNGLAVLLDHPDVREALHAGRLDVAAFVEEVLRHEAPVQLTSRVVLEDGVRIAGVPVPAGSRLVLMLGAANRDPRQYPAPDSFDPARPAVKPLSFGAGAHICLGNGLARLEAAVAFPRLLARFPGLASAPTRPTRRDRLVLRGYETFPVLVAPQPR